MRRPAVIMLVLMGGGMVLWGASRGPSRTCLDARAQQRLDAEAICRSSGGSSGHFFWSGYHGSSIGSSTSATQSVARGGFGAAGHAAGAGS